MMALILSHVLIQITLIKIMTITTMMMLVDLIKPTSLTQSPAASLGGRRRAWSRLEARMQGALGGDITSCSW